MTNKRKHHISLGIVVVAFIMALAGSVDTSIVRTTFLLLAITCFISAVYYKRPDRIRF